MDIASEDVGGCHTHFSDIQLMASGFSSYKEEKGPAFTDEDPATGDAVVNHFNNFFDCVRSRRWQDLNADILEGHLSTSLCHLGNISCRLKRPLHFNSDQEAFVNDAEADAMLTKEYRSPYVLPDQV
jgi:hypothetical protein